MRILKPIPNRDITNEIVRYKRELQQKNKKNLHLICKEKGYKGFWLLNKPSLIKFMLKMKVKEIQTKDLEFKNKISKSFNFNELMGLTDVLPKD